MYKLNTSQKWHKQASIVLARRAKAEKKWLIVNVVRTVLPTIITVCSFILAFTLVLDLCQPR